MRIIIATSSENRSGGTRQALYLAHGLLEKGHNVTMFVPRNSALPPLANPKLDLRFLDTRSSWRSSIEKALPHNNGSNEPCIFHAFHNAMVKQAAWWGLFWRRHKIRLVAHRGVIFRPNNPLPYLSPGISKFIVNSHFCANTIRPFTLWKPNKITVVCNSVPAERIVPLRSALEVKTELGLANDDLVLGMVGNNSHIKGIKPLLNAFKLLLNEPALNKKVKLVLVGPTKNIWQASITELGLQDHLSIISRTESVADYLQIFDVFVIPSLMESLPNTLLEAICMGKACIGSAVGDIPLLLKRCGLCVPANDPKALSTAMLELCNNDKLRNNFSEAAQEDALLYTQETRLAKLLAIYEQVLSKVK